MVEGNSPIHHHQSLCPANVVHLPLNKQILKLRQVPHVASSGQQMLSITSVQKPEMTTPHSKLTCE